MTPNLAIHGYGGYGWETAFWPPQHLELPLPGAPGEAVLRLWVVCTSFQRIRSIISILALSLLCLDFYQNSLSFSGTIALNTWNFGFDRLDSWRWSGNSGSFKRPLRVVLKAKALVMPAPMELCRVCALRITEESHGTGYNNRRTNRKRPFWILTMEHHGTSWNLPKRYFCDFATPPWWRWHHKVPPVGWRRDQVTAASVSTRRSHSWTKSNKDVFYRFELICFDEHWVSLNLTCFSTAQRIPTTKISWPCAFSASCNCCSSASPQCSPDALTKTRHIMIHISYIIYIYSYIP